MNSVLNHDVKTITGEKIHLDSLNSKSFLIVNVASKCGFTRQYEDLEKLAQKYSSDDLTVLGFPCNQFGAQEPGTDSEIMEFCRLTYGVSFPMFAKIDVNGKSAHPLYTSLKSALKGEGENSDIIWNFEKFLVNGEGIAIKRYHPKTEITDIEIDVKALIN